jgi:hypothetical protein
MKTQWISIGIAVFALVGGSGWGKYLLERHNAQVESSQTVLNGFLLPLQSILNTNKRFHSALTQDQEFRNLEYAPDYLQRHFSSLPDTDSRKLAWQALIESVLEDNRRAATLIQENAGHILRDDFRGDCDDFVYHAKTWEAIWRSALGTAPVPASMLGAGRLIAPAFPETMDSLLSLEIQDWRRLAGD